MERGILFVDDEEHILSALGRELRPWFEERKLAYYQARSGAEALEFLESNQRKVLVLVSDLKMPGMTGDELIALARQSRPDLEAVLISGYAEMQGVSRAVAAGIRGFVPKPWDTATLTAELDKALADRERSRLAQVAYNHLTYQLTRTRDIQKTLFRNDSLDPDRFRLELSYRPLNSHFCGGDFYEVVRLSADRCLVLLGDVSGHGAEAAFVTGVIHTLITRDEVFQLPSDDSSPSLLLERLNGLILDILPSDYVRNIALTALLFDHQKGTLRLANAGGLPILRFRQGVGQVFHRHGFPLGMTGDADYHDLHLATQPGDRWVLMTDGLVDRGQQGFIAGPEVLRLVGECLMAGQGNDEILGSFQTQFPERQFLDDLTLIALEVL